MDNFKRTVFAWGYGDSMANALQGVATLFGAEEGAFFGVAKVAALLGFIATLLAYFSARAMADPLRIVKFYVVFIGVVSLFFGFRVPVQVQDKALNQTYVVQNVPYPVAYVLAFITQIEDAIAKQVDRAFRLEGHYCGSQKMGIFACSQIMAQAMDMRVVDPYLYFNLTNFFQDCVFTNILDGTLNAHQLETSDNLYSLIFNHSYLHPARFTVLYDGRRPCTYPCNEPCGGGCSMSCVDAGAYLSSALSRWVNYHGFKALSATVGQTVLMDLLNMVPTQIMHLSQMGTGFLMQAVLMNQFKETYRSWAASYGMGLTEQGIFTKGQIERATANRYLPLINGILHVLFASLVPVLVVFMLTPLMKGALMFTFIFGLWMIVWKFTEAVVNGFFYSKLYGNFYNFAQQGRWDFNLLNAPVISALLVDHISLASSLYWLIPTVSFVVASLGGYAFHSFATGLGGVVQSTAQASAGDVARGNFNAGQVNYRNVSAGNTSFGSFVLGTTDAFKNSVLQESYRNIVKQGGRVEGKGLRVSSALLKAFYYGDDYTKNVLMAMAEIAGLDANADITISSQGRLEYAAFYSGRDGFKVIYDGSGNLKVISQGVEHRNIKLNKKGKIDGPGRIMSLGDISLSIMRAMKKDIQEQVEMYRQTAEELKRLYSIKDDAKRFQEFKNVLENLFKKDRRIFEEVIKAFGWEKIFQDALNRTLSKKLSDEWSGAIGIEGKVGVKTGSPTGFFNVAPVFDASAHAFIKGQYQKAYQKSRTEEKINQALEKFFDSIRNMERERKGTITSTGNKKTYEKGFEKSESFEREKMAEVSEMLLKKAQDLLTFANSINVEMAENPLNDYYRQKYEEGLALFNGNEARAVRYAHEELKKLIEDQDALNNYIKQYATRIGLKILDEKEDKLKQVQYEVPSEEYIKKQGEDIRNKVGEELERVKDEIRVGKKNRGNPKDPSVEQPRNGKAKPKPVNRVPPEYNKVLNFLNQRNGNNNSERPPEYNKVLNLLNQRNGNNNSGQRNRIPNIDLKR
jgi:hypothetical protein